MRRSTAIHAASRCCWPYIKTEDELAVRQNFNGRTVEQNIGETTRHGAELALDRRLSRAAAICTAAAAGYWVANLRAGLEQATRHWRFSEFARLDNLFNRSYVGSVIVNESNQRYFEAAPGRTAYLMLNAAWRTD